MPIRKMINGLISEIRRILRVRRGERRRLIVSIARRNILGTDQLSEQDRAAHTRKLGPRREDLRIALAMATNRESHPDPIQCELFNAAAAVIDIRRDSKPELKAVQ